MKQQDKDLLLKDICARLPYGVKVQDESGRVNKLVIGNADLIRLYYDDFSIYSEEQISLPLLRPMSSMTDEERKEYKHLVAFSGSPEGAANFIDWLNKKMFAYRTIDGKDMFELGLAIEAPTGMYK